MTISVNMSPPCMIKFIQTIFSILSVIDGESFSVPSLSECFASNNNGELTETPILIFINPKSGGNKVSLHSLQHNLHIPKMFSSFAFKICIEYECSYLIASDLNFFHLIFQKKKNLFCTGRKVARCIQDGLISVSSIQYNAWWTRNRIENVRKC